MHSQVQVWAEGWVQVWVQMWVQVWVQRRKERLEEVTAPCWLLGRREEWGEGWLEKGRGGEEGVGVDAEVIAALLHLGAWVDVGEGEGMGREVGGADGALLVTGEDVGEGTREARGGKEGGEEGVKWIQQR